MAPGAVVALMLVGLGLGVAFSPLFLRHVEERFLGGAAAEARLAALEGEVRALRRAEALAPTGDTARRLDAIEARTRRLSESADALGARMDGFSSAVAAISAARATPADQARDLMLLAAARRFVAMGRPFGSLADALAARFGSADPGALEALRGWTAAPVSSGLLDRRLAELPRAGIPDDLPAGAGWWERVRAGLSRLVTVRKPAGAGGRPVALAAAALESGDVALAATLMENQPPSPQLRQWLADARRLAAAMAALDRLEMRVFEASLATAAQPGTSAKTP
jgi:hypothetical protein